MISTLCPKTVQVIVKQLGSRCNHGAGNGRCPLGYGDVPLGMQLAFYFRSPGNAGRQEDETMLR